MSDIDDLRARAHHATRIEQVMGRIIDELAPNEANRKLLARLSVPDQVDWVLHHTAPGNAEQQRQAAERAAQLQQEQEAADRATVLEKKRQDLRYRGIL